MMSSSIMRNGLLLAIFAVIATAVTTLTYQLTADRIAQQQRLRLQQLLAEVVPPHYHDHPLYAHCALVEDPILGAGPRRIYRAFLAGELNALVIEGSAPDGYSGNIEFVVGIDTEMQVLGVRVLDHRETPGLGDKIELAVSQWILSFNGRRYTPNDNRDWTVKKEGGTFDQFTGATITPRALVRAVARVVEQAYTKQDEWQTLPNACESMLTLEASVL